MTERGEWDDLDLATADRMLSGLIPPAGAPEGYDRVATLVQVVQESVAPEDQWWEPAVVAAMARTLQSPVRASRGPGRAGRTRRAKRRPWVVAPAAMFAVLSVGTAAAAANRLPAPIQSAFHQAASVLGVHIPAGPRQAAVPAHHTTSAAPAEPAATRREAASPRASAEVNKTAPVTVTTRVPKPASSTKPDPAVRSAPATTPAATTPATVPESNTTAATTTTTIPGKAVGKKPTTTPTSLPHSRKPPAPPERRSGDN